MFWLVERAPLDGPQRGSPQMFRVGWIERYLSRVRPWQVLLLWLPVSAAVLGHALADRALRPAALLGEALSGLLAWTLLEYLLHRCVFHFRPAPGSALQRDLAFIIHGVHHDYPHDRDRLVMPPLLSALIAGLLVWPLWLSLGRHAFYPFFGGLVLGYLWYDLTHYAAHHRRALTPLGRWQKRNHMQHHFGPHGACYGVTTPLWDYVFGTRPARLGGAGGPVAQREQEDQQRQRPGGLGRAAP